MKVELNKELCRTVFSFKIFVEFLFDRYDKGMSDEQMIIEYYWVVQFKIRK